MRMQLASVDLVREFRLRNWARKNYVRAEDRGRHWHPIVLEEMQFRDAELAEMEGVMEDSYSPFVPLEPTERNYLDDPHPAVPTPKLVQMSVERAVSHKS